MGRSRLCPPELCRCVCLHMHRTGYAPARCKDTALLRHDGAHQRVFLQAQAAAAGTSPGRSPTGAQARARHRLVAKGDSKAGCACMEAGSGMRAPVAMWRNAAGTSSAPKTLYGSGCTSPERTPSSSNARSSSSCEVKSFPFQDFLICFERHAAPNWHT